MFCTHCGVPVRTEDEFCAACGHRLHPAPTAAPAVPAQSPNLGPHRGRWVTAGVVLLALLAAAAVGGVHLGLRAADVRTSPPPDRPAAPTAPSIEHETAPPAPSAPSAPSVPSAPVTVTASPSTQPHPAPDADHSALLARASTGVVMIRATTCEGEGVGSGFLVSPHQVLTAAHVVQGAASVAVGHDEEVYAATVTGIDSDADVALLDLTQPIAGGHVFDLATDQIPAGTEVAVIGHPLGDPLTITEGNVSRSDDQLWPDVQLDVSVSPGNSGGPVLDRDGNVVGVLLAKDTEREGLAYALRSDFVLPVLTGGATLPAFRPAACAAPLGPDHTQIPRVPAEVTLRDAIAETFANYFGGINGGDYRRAYAELAPAFRATVDYASFADGVSTSFDFDFRVRSVTPTLDGAEVWLEFVSLQAPSQGPQGESCTEWTLDYRLVWLLGGDMAIAGASPHSGDGHTPCP